MEQLPPEEIEVLIAGAGYIRKRNLEKRLQLLTGYHKKVMAAIAFNVMMMVEKWGIENCLFLTLTFAEHITDPKEAEKRFHSLVTGVLDSSNGRYLGWLAVLERHKSGRLHYHVLVACKGNVRGQINFAEIDDENYRSANAFLRAEWAFWRKTGKLYKFGRIEALPVKSCSDAIARYVSKYISKHIDRREDRGKGVRLWKCSREVRKMGVRFMWESKRTRAWRAAVGRFAKAHGIRTPEALAREFGPKWAFHLGEHIMTHYGEEPARQLPVLRSEDPPFSESAWDPEAPSEVENPDYERNASSFAERANDPAWREIRLQNVRDLLKKGNE